MSGPELTMGDAEAKATFIFDYVAQPGPDPRGEGRAEESVAPLLSTCHIIHVLCQDHQQYPGTAGPDVAHYL